MQNITIKTVNIINNKKYVVCGTGGCGCRTVGVGAVKLIVVKDNLYLL